MGDPVKIVVFGIFFFFSSRRRHTRFDCDWSSDVCSSDLAVANTPAAISTRAARLAIAAIAAYQVLLIGMIFLRPDLDPSWRTMSEWAKIGRASCRERV